jgi:flagellar hook-associated protein 2
VSISAISSSAGSPISFNGLASGLNTGEIISALLAVEREPITRFSHEQIALEGQREQLQSLQSSLTQLTFAAQELSSPVLFNTAQAVSSSDPTQIAATTTTGAAVGGYEVNVTQLANSAQRTFTFKSPAAADTLTIDGKEIKVAAGASIQELVKTINSNSTATVYAAAVGGETVVLSTRATGATGAEFIKVTDPGGTLVEQAGLAKEGKNAEYTVDGVAASSTSNTVTTAIAGVTLNLKALTTTSGPVTIDVEPPAPDVATITAQVQSFVKLYNSTIGTLQTQLTTKPPTSPQTTAELQTGTLFGDSDLEGLLNGMRQRIYQPIAGLPAEMSSLANIGVSTGSPSGKGTPSQSAVEGQLQLNTAELEKAIQTNPAGVQTMLQGWSKSFQEAINVQAAPGGVLEGRISGDSTQVTELTGRVAAMNEMLAIRQKTLQEEFAAMEKVVSQNQAQASWLSSQLATMLASSVSSSSSSTSSSHG